MEELIEAAGVASELRHAISELPQGERMVAELVILDGLTPADAARALGILSATARMRLARARVKLRRSFPAFSVAATESASAVKEVSP